MAAGGEWRVVPYPWDVDAVLEGDEDYPVMLKVRLLEQQMAADGIDGIALGIRAAESKSRTVALRTRGLLYWAKKRQAWTCAPLAWWTAEEVVGYILARDAVPLNPVYHKLTAAPPLDYLRDGTWYPREVSDADGYREWLAMHYADCIPSYDQALEIQIVRGLQS